MMKQQIGEFSGIKHYINDDCIGFTGVNAVDFLSKIYDPADPNYGLLGNTSSTSSILASLRAARTLRTDTKMQVRQDRS